jgi:holliday junction DNA helicase RuvA
MITYLKGFLTKKSPTEAVIDVGGIGYSVHISLSTYEKLSEIGTPLQLLTYFHIREDIQQLFGFFTDHEREMFKLLISISGIGPRMAQTILSGIRPDELVRIISMGNISALVAVPGVGKKTAERLILELKDKVGKIDSGIPVSGIDQSSISIRSEALNALLSLGFSREKAEVSIRTVLNESDSKSISIEELIKRALQNTNR